MINTNTKQNLPQNSILDSRITSTGRNTNINNPEDQPHDFNSSKLYPGSKLAVDLGCICKQDPDNNSYLLHESCPLHWHISIVKKLNDIQLHAFRQDKMHSTLLGGLIILASFAIGLQIFM